jgi:cell division protein FtsQ
MVARGAHAKPEAVPSPARPRPAWRGKDREPRGRVEDREPRRRSALVIVVGVLCLLLVLSGVTYAALHSPLFSATTVLVTGEHHETASQIERAAGLAGAPPMISVDPASIKLRLEAAFPWIDTATVTPSWPHTVSIRVVERRPVAVVASTNGVLVLVDLTGRRLGLARPGQTLPRIEYTATIGGQTSPGQISGAAEPGLLVAATLPPAFAWQVSVIQVSPIGWVALHLDTPVTFLLGPASNLGAKYEDVAAVIARTTLHAGDVVDVSVPQAMTVTGP